jgi:hypothetical protein
VRVAVPLLFAVVATSGCRGRAHVDVRSDPAAASASIETSSDAGTPVTSPFLGELVAEGGRFVSIDDAYVRWATSSEIQNQKHELYDYFEAPHTDIRDARRLPIRDEDPIYIDRRWIVTWVYGFNVEAWNSIHDRTTNVARNITLPCAPTTAIADATRAVLVGICDGTTWARSEVYVFDLTTGDLRPWFVTAGHMLPVALDAARFYYSLGEDLRARSRTSGVDVVLRHDLGSSHVVVSGADAYDCGRTLERFPLDGSPSTDLGLRCTVADADAGGLAFTAPDGLYALDAGSSTPRRLVEYHGATRGPAVARAWIYFATTDGLRRVPRRAPIE